MRSKVENQEEPESLSRVLSILGRGYKSFLEKSFIYFSPTVITTADAQGLAEHWITFLVHSSPQSLEKLHHAVRMAVIVVTVEPEQRWLYLFCVAPAEFFLGHGVLVRRCPEIHLGAPDVCAAVHHLILQCFRHRGLPGDLSEMGLLFPRAHQGGHP